MSITLDFTDVEDKEFETLPEGTYHAVVFDIEKGESSQKGTPLLNFEFKILGGDHDGSRVWEDYYLTDGAKWRLKKALSALVPERDHSGKLDFDPQDYMGIECDIEITHSQYNNKTYANVEEILPNEEGAGNSEAPF